MLSTVILYGWVIMIVMAIYTAGSVSGKVDVLCDKRIDECRQEYLEENKKHK